MTPVPKCWDKHSMALLVSVIPILARVLKTIVHDQVYKYLENNNILKEEQAGFKPNRSTQDIFLRTIDDYKTSLDL